MLILKNQKQDSDTNLLKDFIIFTFTTLNVKNMNTLGLKDFSEKIQKGFVETDSTPTAMKKIVLDNFSKGRIDENEFCEANDIIDSFEKGNKRTDIGEFKEFEGNRYQKTAEGWIYSELDENLENNIEVQD